MSTSDPDCLFCKIVAGEIPATIVAETDRSVAFRDVNPQAPTHVLVVPRRHAATIRDLADHDAEATADVFRLAARVAENERILDGYRLVANTGPGAGQTVFHAHVHVLGGRPLSWPPG
jgi:histidine triad (HIT) family protein